MNSVNLIGRLTKDPEIRKTSDGHSVSSLRLAVDDTFSSSDRADFISVSVFGSQAELCKRYLKKGFLCGVSGRMRADEYVSKEGVKRYPISVIANRVQFLQWPPRPEKQPEEAVASGTETATAGETHFAPETAETAYATENEQKTATESSLSFESQDAEASHSYTQA